MSGLQCGGAAAERGRVLSIVQKTAGSLLVGTEKKSGGTLGRRRELLREALAHDHRRGGGPGDKAAADGAERDPADQCTTDE